MDARKEARKAGKVSRVPFGQHKLKLQLSDIDREALDSKGFVTRWVNDVGGRLNQAQAGGWAFVDPEEATSLGASAVHDPNTSLGKQVRQVVSKGKDPIFAYLMKIRKEFYDEDQKAKMDEIDEMEQGLIQGEAGGAKVGQTYLPPGVRAPVVMSR